MLTAKHNRSLLEPIRTCTCVQVGGAVQLWAAGQTAEDHGGHQLIHVHFLRLRFSAGRHRLSLGNTQMLDKTS